MAERLGIALAGCGGVASQYHLRALQANPRANLVAIADPSPAARDRLSQLDGTTLTRDVGELLCRRDVEAVVVCAPTPAHAELAMSIARAGRHLYLEKPLALTLDDAAEIERVTSLAGSVTAIGFNYRFNPLFRRLKALVEAEAVGEPRRLRTWFWEPAKVELMPAWRRRRATGGGVLLDLASHEVDLVRWVLGQEIATVEHAEVYSRAAEQDEARLELRTEAGVVVESSLRYGAGLLYRWELEGTNGVLRLDRWPPRLVRDRRASRSRASARVARLRALPIPKREPSFALALEAFVDRALGGVAELPSVADGRKSLELVLASEAAAA